MKEAVFMSGITVSFIVQIFWDSQANIIMLLLILILWIFFSPAG